MPLLLLLSTIVKSQHYVSWDFIDSSNKVEQGNIGKNFPAFNAKDINGNTFSNSTLAGKITLINFWFEGCHPCVAEFEALNEIFEKFRNNKLFNFITFTFDDTLTINENLKKYSLRFPIISMSEEECHRLNFGRGFPTNMIVTKDAKVAFIKSGGPTDSKIASEEIDSTLVPKLLQLLNLN